MRAGITDAKGLAAKRKYAIVATFVVAAVITPPDPVSQISLAIPILILYEVSILCAKLVEKRRAAQAALDEAAAATPPSEAASTDVSPT